MEMTFRQFAFNNVLRNKRLYAAYFLSSLFTVMVFFTFANFAFHPELTGENMNSSVLKGLSVAGGIIYVFSFFFVLYSMSAFLHSRKKEFGILFVHGMTNRQIRSMIFLENMFIGFFATIFGILLGLIFSKVILLIAENVLIIEGNLPFYFPTLAIIITFVSFILLFLTISIVVPIVLRTTKLVTLIKGNMISKPEPKLSLTLVMLAMFLIGAGYAISLRVSGLEVVVALLPVSILVIVGTYFLFSQASVWMINHLKRNEKLFWKETNMLLFSDLAYRMKDNARSFFIVAIISTVAFSAIGTLFGLNSYLTKGIVNANPVTYSYTVDDDMDESTLEDVLEMIESTLTDHELQFEKEMVTLNYFSQNDGEMVYIAPVSDYNRIAKFIGEKQIEVRGGEVIPVPSSTRTVDGTGYGPSKLSAIKLKDGTEVKVLTDKEEYAKRDVLPEFYHYYIVSDELYKRLPEPDKKVPVYEWQVVKGSKENIISAGEMITDELHGSFVAVDYIVHTIKEIYSPIMFVGLFIGIIFFVSAGSFLYFRLYTDLEDDQRKFHAISKIGLTKHEMKKIISQQTAILFFTPIIVALLHGAIALTALSRLFSYRLIEESAIVLGTFFVIQVIYYLLVRYFYIRQINSSLS